MRHLSHNLEDALALARRRKLGKVVKLSLAEVRAIRVLNITYGSTELRYIVTGNTKYQPTRTLSRAPLNGWCSERSSSAPAIGPRNKPEEAWSVVTSSASAARRQV